MICLFRLRNLIIYLKVQTPHKIPYLRIVRARARKRNRKRARARERERERECEHAFVVVLALGPT